MLSSLAILMDSVIRWDHQIARWLNQFAGDNPALDRFIYNSADSVLLKGGLFMAFLWWQWFRSDGTTVERRQTILITLAGAIVAVGVARMLQELLPDRQRPLHNVELGLVTPAGVNPGTLTGWSSLPSDHAVLFFALAMAVWRLHRTYGVLAFLWSAAVICLPRVYLGYHYASDVLIGALVGIVIMRLVFALPLPGLLSGPLLRWEARHTASFYCIAFLATFELAVLFKDVRQAVGGGFELARHLTAAPTVAMEPR